MYIPSCNVAYHSTMQYSTSSHIPPNKNTKDKTSYHANKGQSSTIGKCKTSEALQVL